MSERQSPRGSTALKCHCSSRWVLVNVPSFSVWAAAGMKNTSVPISSGREFAHLDLLRVVPEGSGLDLAQITDDEPVEVLQRLQLHAAVGRPDGGVLADHDEPPGLAVDHPQHHRVVRVVAVDTRKEVEAEVRLLVGRLAPPGLHQAHEVAPERAPRACVRPVLLDVLIEVVGRVRVRHRDVARQDVVEGRDIGRALDVGVPAQREDAAAGPADVAEQQLDDRGGADVLDAVRVLGPADRVADRARALATRVAAERLGHLDQLLARHAADLLHHLGRVGGEVAFEDLEDAAGVLERLVLLGRLAVAEFHPVGTVRHVP